MKRLLTILCLLTACGPTITDPEACEPGFMGCEPLDGYWCYDGRPSPTGICMDTVAADEDVESCEPYASVVSDPLETLGGRRFCIASCETDEDCSAAATGLGHDLQCFDIDGTQACGLHDWSARWPE